MGHEFKLEKFTGPLDLLLQLVHEEKMDISEVSLSRVTEQYLRSLGQIENQSPEELADFLLIAARLLLLKSKKLLPQFVEEEDDGPSLADQLRLYQLFVQASKTFEKKWNSDSRSVFRNEPLRRPVEFVPPENLSFSSLSASIANLLERIKPPKPLPQTHLDKAITIREKVEYLQGLLSKQRQIRFSEALQIGKSRTDIIVSFLALLEMVKLKQIQLDQDNVFSDIVIKSVF